MKRIYYIIALFSVLFTSCHSVEEYENNPKGNFEALWTILDEHYCFFREKNIDWDEVHARYSRQISPKMTQRELFDVCSAMLEELQDGHVNLTSSFDVSYYTKWWSDYPQNYDERLIEEHYFNFGLRQASSLKYGVLKENVGYIRYSSFSGAIGEGNLDAALSYLATCQGLIIDVRDNGGGDLTNVDILVARFITERKLMGYLVHKKSPARDDFSEPYAYYIDPAPKGRVMWGKPVIVLTNRSTFSAANNFVSVMKSLPQVKIAGDVTGGGSGIPFTSELPIGWGIRFSSCSVLDGNGNITEFGVSPSAGLKVDLDENLALQGIDTILEKAIETLTK
ncbi:MAG: S41 family peptidase [Muribaculaceae bacterium]